jgi:hypothetical protein
VPKIINRIHSHTQFLSNIHKAIAGGHRIGIAGGAKLGKTWALQEIQKHRSPWAWVYMDLGHSGKLHPLVLAQNFWHAITSQVIQPGLYGGRLPAQLFWPPKVSRAPDESPTDGLRRHLAQFFNSLRDTGAQRPYVLLLDNFDFFWESLALPLREALSTWWRRPPKGGHLVLESPLALVLTGRPYLDNRGTLGMPGEELLSEPLRPLALLSGAAAEKRIEQAIEDKKARQELFLAAGNHPFLIQKLLEKDRTCILEWCEQQYAVLQEQVKQQPIMGKLWHSLLKKSFEHVRFIAEASLRRDLGATSIQNEARWLAAQGLISRDMLHLEPELYARVQHFNRYYFETVKKSSNV